jgi:DNA processing protein
MLYYAGNWDLVFTKSIAIVGTRHPTKEGLLRTERITRELVRNNFTIISGLAAGIDTQAHTTAINEGGNTIAVTGTPLDVTYPKENQELFNEIVKNHLVISQVPFIKYATQDYRLNRFYFPERNKTMSALSDATIIVEAGETSGTLIQARAALKEQNRKLFILASCFDKGLTWPKKYQADGAIKVNSIQDILQNLETTDVIDNTNKPDFLNIKFG